MDFMYQRTTTTADLSTLPPAIEAALRTYADEHQLEVTDDLPAWVTRSLNPTATSFLGKIFKRRANPTDPDSEHQTLVVLHPTHLIVVVSGAERGVSTLSVPLALASIRDRLVAPAGGGSDVAEGGFTVGGPLGGDGRQGDFFVGTGPPDGERCRDAIRTAISAAKNP